MTLRYVILRCVMWRYVALCDVALLYVMWRSFYVTFLDVMFLDVVLLYATFLYMTFFYM